MNRPSPTTPHGPHVGAAEKHTLLVALVLLISGVAASAHAATTVKVLATDPPGRNVMLDRNQNFYVRIGYTTDEPVSIWAQPYFHGSAVAAGTNPSRTYTGAGEALGWFFFMKPGDAVDEIRINVGDGSRDGTHLAATYPVHIAGSDTPGPPRTEPKWVVDLNQKDKAAQQEAYEKRMNAPPSAGDWVLYNGFMLAMLGLGVLGFAAPAWGAWRWRGGWRIAAIVPVAMMLFVVLRLLTGVARDPTSHNLWPFEILQAGALSVVIMAALLMARKFAHAER
jgi:hypothetical protein